MQYKTDCRLCDFKAWSGAVDTLKRIIELEKCEEVEAFIEECMPDCTETDINDLLWFEDELIAETCGFSSVEEFYGEEKPE